MKLNLRRGALAGIVRGREVLYPNGMTSVLEGEQGYYSQLGRVGQKS